MTLGSKTFGAANNRRLRSSKAFTIENSLFESDGSQVDIIKLDRTARLEMTMKRDELVALIFSNVAIYLIAVYLSEDYFSGNWKCILESRFSRIFSHSEKTLK